VKNEQRVTLADIAAKAGVHVTTVSMAMRNHPRLPVGTRNRLQALANEMGYRPDPLLRALAAYRGQKHRHRMPVLAYVTNWNTRWGWKKITAHPDFYLGAEAKANQLGYKLEHFWLQEPGLSQVRLGKILFSRGINGLILASHSRAMGDDLRLDWNRFSAVKIDYFPHQPVLHNVTNNQVDIVRLAMKKLLAAGYRRLGFVMHRGWDHAVDHLWTAGFLCEQQHLPGHEQIPAHIFPALHPMALWRVENDTPEVEPAAFQQWLEATRPEVIISKSSFVLPALKKLGLQVPRDIAFVDVFLDDPSGLTAGVRQNHQTVGSVALELLAGQLQQNKFGIPLIPTTTFVEGTWCDGRSCPPLAKPDGSRAPRR
jgi:LacI family transcriptional regulator